MEVSVASWERRGHKKNSGPQGALLLQSRKAAIAPFPLQLGNQSLED